MTEKKVRENQFLNQKPGKFRINRPFRIKFQNGESFYFAADIEVFGLHVFRQMHAVRILFEAETLVIPEIAAPDVVNNYRGYPIQQHIHSSYEYKSGKYSNGQLRE